MADAGTGDSVVAPRSPTQAEVLRAAVAGEPWVYAWLYDALYPFVARALQKILHRTPDYEDLVQASFEQIVRTLQRPRGEQIQNLAAWAGAIAARVAFDSLRARVRDRRVFARDAHMKAEAGPSLQEQLEARADLLWLQEVLSRMNAEQAQVIVLHDILGHELSEVARLTGVSEAAAQKRLSRGHIELKRRAKMRMVEGST
jgi:RNA polymerase sigma-70 factor (ECF subfamily)